MLFVSVLHSLFLSFPIHFIAFSWRWGHSTSHLGHREDTYSFPFSWSQWLILEWKHDLIQANQNHYQYFFFNWEVERKGFCTLGSKAEKILNWQLPADIFPAMYKEKFVCIMNGERIFWWHHVLISSTWFQSSPGSHSFI